MGIAGAVRGYGELTRPGNAVAAGILTFTGAFVAGGVSQGLVPVAAAVATTVLATGGGNAVNDYFDREIDEVNRPDRPIPRGAVTPRGALAETGLLFGSAIGLALTLPPTAIAIAVVNLLLLVAYTEFFKATPGLGNVVVAFLTGSTFLFGGAAVGDLFGATVLFALSGLATLAREVIKDVEDIAGDRQEGLSTLPIAVSEHVALWIAAVSLTVGVVASAVPYLEGTFGITYLAVVIPADAIMLFGVWKSFTAPGEGQRRLKLGMFLAIAAFLLGRTVITYG